MTKMHEADMTQIDIMLDYIFNNEFLNDIMKKFGV